MQQKIQLVIVNINRLIFTLILTTFISYPGISQLNNCDCKADLIFLDAKIKKSPAYKNNKETYNIEFNRLSNLVESTTTTYACFVLLNSLMLSLNDNHSRIYGLDKGLTNEVKNDSLKFDSFKRSEIFSAYPIFKINLDSLTNILNTKKLTDIEGVYSIKNFLTIGFFKDKKQNEYKAIVLHSETDIWRNGELLYTAIPFGKNYLLNIGGSLSSKRLIAYTEKIENGFFQFMGFSKNQELENYAIKIPTDMTYFRDELTNEITYLRIGSFNSWNPTLNNAEKFYKKLEGTLSKPNLILDLRNNGGGGDRNSDLLFKILKSYGKTKKIYILINHRTVSNAEQFANKLSKLPNCIILGQQSNGTVAYEIKNSDFELPSGYFTAVLTSKTHSKYLELESQGVMPNIELSIMSDWIEQTIKIIEEKNKLKTRIY